MMCFFGLVRLISNLRNQRMAQCEFLLPYIGIASVVTFPSFYSILPLDLGPPGQFVLFP